MQTSAVQLRTTVDEIVAYRSRLLSQEVYALVVMLLNEYNRIHHGEGASTRSTGEYAMYRASFKII